METYDQFRAGHQLLRMRIYSNETGKPASWGHMTLRQFVFPLSYAMIAIISIITGAALDVGGKPVGLIIAAVGYFTSISLALTESFWIFKRDKTKDLRMSLLILQW
jgi:hypothetical protein